MIILNYGRDNDTTAAATGAMLGAYYGADNLPKEMVEEIIKTNFELVNDFESLFINWLQLFTLNENRVHLYFFTVLIDEFITFLPTAGCQPVNTSALSLRKIIYKNRIA